MKSIVLVLLSLSLASLASAKDLKVNCSNTDDESIALQATLANANAQPEIQSLVVNDEEMDNATDVSSLPVYTDGKIQLRVQFGPRRYSSVEIEVSDCQDSFTATGKATIKTYVGGFAGTSLSELKCTCDLK